MAEEKPKDEEKNSEEHTHPSSSPGRDNPRKRKTPLLPSLSNCHSCGRHLSVKSPQTLTDFHTLNSQWRIVVLCSDCLRLVRSAANCSYCFSPVAEDSFLDCRQCCFRVHAGCVPRQRRLFSPSDLDPETFACVDCCPLPRFRGGRPPGFSVSRVPAAEELDSVTKQENPVRRSEDDVAKDEELALQLHLEMNGSRRISRCCRVKGPSKNGGAGVDKGFLDSWVLPDESSSFVRTEPEKEKEIACGKGNDVGTVLKYYCRRAAKLNGGMVLGKTGRGDKLNRYLIKYKRRSKLKPMMNQENQVAPNLKITCSPGCQS